MINKLMWPFAIGLVLAIGYIWFLHGQLERKNAKLSDYKNKYSHSLKHIEALQKQAEKAQEVRKRYLSKLTDYENKNAILQNRVDNHSKQLRINAKCPDMPKTADSARVATGSAELNEDARRAYFNLRAGIAETLALLQLCQETLNYERQEM